MTRKRAAHIALVIFYCILLSQDMGLIELILKKDWVTFLLVAAVLITSLVLIDKLLDDDKEG